MRDYRIFTTGAILLLAVWAGYNIYMSYTSPSYCPVGSHSIYSYSNLLPILLILILAFSLLPGSKSRSRPSSKLSMSSGQHRLAGNNSDLDVKLDAIRANSRGDPGEEATQNGGVHGDVQPKDILSIIRENPGITQEELREVTGYSASKVSVQVRELEERGLIRREKHGRTFRIYPE